MEKTAAQHIREALKTQGGWLPFDQFMELALYSPGQGYYEQDQARVGRSGDFITSVRVGSVFGEMIAWQIREWLKLMETRSSDVKRWTLLEAGAHEGALAADILGWFRQQAPEWLDRIEYVLVEPSETRQSWQRRFLSSFVQEDRVALKWIPELPSTPVNGVLLSNELLDAFPVVRIGWNAQRRAWFVQGVAQQNDRFVWSPSPHGEATAGELGPVAELPDSLLSVLPDGYTVDWSPAAEAWWGRAADTLRSGVLFTVDYGLRDLDVFSPHRHKGTLRGYSKHRHVQDVLEDPGIVDLTAHVLWSRILQRGESRGLRTLHFCSQREWLSSLFLRMQSRPEGFPQWSAPRIRQFQTLTHPDHFGERFQVLVQTRGEIEVA